MKHFKITVVLLIFALFGGLLQYCSSEEGTAPSTEEQATSSTTTTTTTTSESSTSSSSEIVPGDNCQNAIPVLSTSEGGVFSETGEWLTYTYPAASSQHLNADWPRCGSYGLTSSPRYDLFFIFTLSQDASISFTAQHESTDIVIALYNYSCPDHPSNCITYADSAYPYVGGTEKIINHGLSKGTYLAQIANYPSGSAFTDDIHVAFKFYRASDVCSIGSANYTENHDDNNNSSSNPEDTGLSITTGSTSIAGSFTDNSPDYYKLTLPAGTNMYSIKVTGCIQSFTGTDAKVQLIIDNTVVSESYIDANGLDNAVFAKVGQGPSPKNIIVAIVNGNSSSNNYENTPYKLVVHASPIVTGDTCQNAIPMNDSVFSLDSDSGYYVYTYPETSASLLTPDWGYCNYNSSSVQPARTDLFFLLTLTSEARTNISATLAATEDVFISIYNSDTCPIQPTSCIARRDSHSSTYPYENLQDIVLPAGTYFVQIGLYPVSQPQFSSSIQVAYKLELPSEICDASSPDTTETSDTTNNDYSGAQDLGSISAGWTHKVVGTFSDSDDTNAPDYYKISIGSGSPYLLTVKACIQSFQEDVAKLQIIGNDGTSILAEKELTIDPTNNIITTKVYSGDYYIAIVDATTEVKATSGVPYAISLSVSNITDGDTCANALTASFGTDGSWGPVVSVDPTTVETLTRDWKWCRGSSWSSTNVSDLFISFSLDQQSRITFTAMAASSDIVIDIFPAGSDTCPNIPSSCIAYADSGYIGGVETLQTILDPGVYYAYIANAPIYSELQGTVSFAFKKELPSTLCTASADIATYIENDDTTNNSPDTAEEVTSNIFDYTSGTPFIIVGSFNDSGSNPNDFYKVITPASSDSYHIIITACIQAFNDNGDARLRIYNIDSTDSIYNTIDITAEGGTVALTVTGDNNSHYIVLGIYNYVSDINYSNDTPYQINIYSIKSANGAGDRCDNAIEIHPTADWQTYTYLELDAQYLNADWYKSAYGCSWGSTTTKDLFLTFTLDTPKIVTITSNFETSDDKLMSLYDISESGCSVQPSSCIARDYDFGSNDLEIQQLLDPGTYIIRVSPYYSTGNFTSDIVVAYKANSADELCTLPSSPNYEETEPNNSLSDANDAGTLIAGSTFIITGTFQDSESEDYYKITIPAGTRTYIMTIKGCMQSFIDNDAKLAVYTEPYSTALIDATYISADEVSLSTISILQSPSSEKYIYVGIIDGATSTNSYTSPVNYKIILEATTTYGVRLSSEPLSWTSDCPLDNITGSWTEITSTITDEGLYNIPSSALPSNFTFYGEEVTAASVSTNGWIVLMPIGSYYGADYSNDPIPDTNTPNGILAVAWDDLKTEIYYCKDSSGNLHVYWEGYPYGLSSTNTYKFVATLYASSSKIEYYYETITGTNNDVTIGIENGNGTLGTPVYYDGNSYLEGFNFPDHDADGKIIIFEE